jgi:diguanylate cyclase (GGDEF)-like protein
VVLVVDDERDILATIQDQLRNRFQVITAIGPIEGLSLLVEHDVAVVLSDQRMPGIDGAEFLARVRAASPDVARILLTGYADLHAVIDAVNRGQIYAYVEKPWDPDALEALVSRAVERQALLRERDELLSQLKHANRELEQRVEERTRELAARNRDLEAAYRHIEELARTDPLTGLLNRRGLAELARREVHRANRTGQPVAVLMLDLDHFKAINDELGHDVGDAVLRAVGALLQTTLRPYDVSSRLGGEEFAVLLPGCSLHSAVAIAERLRARLVQSSIAGLPRAVTASFGVTTLRIDEDLDAALRRADVALYRSKHQGRDRVTSLPADQETP